MFLAEQTAAAHVPAVYKQLAESNHWGLLGPEIAVALLSLLVLVDGMLLKNRKSWYTPATVKFFLLGILGFTGYGLFSGLSPEGVSFGGLLIQHGWFTDVARIFFLLTAFVVTHLASQYLPKKNLVQNEFYHLVLVATAAMMLLVQSNHFVLFFLALETVAVTLYVLVGYNRNSAFSLEAGVKYLVTGGLSSALLLAGIVLLYGVGGNTTLNTLASAQDMFRFDHLQVFLASHGDLPLAKAGVALVLAGVAFKVGAFPFNVWIPDVYQGAPTPTAAFLAIGSKAAGVFSLLILTVIGPNAPFARLDSLLLNVFIPVTALTLIFGNFAALGQQNVKRLLGLSGISHAGFLLLGLLAIIVSKGTPNADSALIAVLVYLFVYLLSSTLVFGVVGHVAGDEDATNELRDYRRIYKRNPLLAVALATGVGSLAGIPPSLGFVSKLLILIAAFKAAAGLSVDGHNGLFGLIAIALVGVVLGIYYYLGWLREAFNRVESDTEAEPIAVGCRSRILLSLLSIILVFGFLGGLIYAVK